MNDFVAPLESFRQIDVGRVGGKAAMLGTLAEAGFPIPAGLAITSAAFHAALAPFRSAIGDVLQRYDLQAADVGAERAQAAAEEVDSLLAGLTVPEPVVAALREALPALGDAETLLAVRSSATAEDRADASFAGQYATILAVLGESAILDAIVACWRSFFTANALVARAAHGALAQDEAMAVLVQRMVDAECSGVCFTVDPVRHDRDVIVVNAAWGLGLGTVDGSVANDTAWVRRERIQIDEQRIVEKPEQIALLPEGGVGRIPVAEERRRAAVLPEGWLQRVAEFGLAAEALFGRAQDMEWAIANGQLWVLQSRPITALPPELQEAPSFPVTWESDEDRRSSWGLGSSDYKRISPPLEQDLMDEFDKALGDAGLWMGSWVGSDTFFRKRLVNGRVYFSDVPGELSQGDRRIRKAAATDLAARLWESGLTAWEHWGPEVIKATERLAAFVPAEADGAKLAEHLEDALAVMRRHWAVHWLLFPFPEPANPFHAAFAAVSGLAEKEAEEARAKLLEGEETKLTRLIDGLYAMACAAREAPAVAAVLAEAPPNAYEVLHTMPEAEPVRALLDAFLTIYGDRCGSGFGSDTTISTPTWRQRPDLVLALAAPYLDPALESPTAARERARSEREQALEALCAACSDPEAVADLRRSLPFARKQATLLEEHNHYIDQMSIGQLHEASLRAARWLVEHGALGEIEEIYWLHVPEMTTALREETPKSLAHLIAERKAQHAAWEALRPPSVLGTPRAKLDDRPPLKDEVTSESPEDANRLKGQAASSGRRRGRARIVASETVMPDLAPGDILVAENAGPLWTPIFPILGGLVLDHGALTQHAATTAREYGIPAVLNTRKATRRIRDGAWIIIDGTAGIVELETEPGAELPA